MKAEANMLFLVVCCTYFSILILKQGGIGITKSLDTLAATSLRYDYSEIPRLVSLENTYGFAFRYTSDV